MDRVAVVAAVLAIALVPITALAGSPSPSPSLDTVLAPAPSGYTEITTSALRGEFTAHDYALNGTGANPNETERTLKDFGFVDGYAKRWGSDSVSRVIIEAVMAFSGGSGATHTMAALKQADTADPHYTNADTLANMDSYYGAHFKGDTAFEDEFVFVKGNDLFLILVAGTQDDVLSTAEDQANAEYNFAPADTIPPWQWPDQGTNTGTFPTGLPLTVAFAVVVGLVVRFYLNRQRRSARVMPVGTYAPPPMSAVQMSPDGNFWWDGQTWRDVTQEAPPSAQRSTDGSLWWDGSNWRPVPGATQPTPPPAG